MKDEESQTATKRDGFESGNNGGGFIWGKGRYKIWALAGILLLAFWSMFTGSVTLKWSAGNLNSLSTDLDSPITDDLDILELEEREKHVRHLWDVYTHSTNIRLPKFWLEAFKAAYEDLISEVPGVRNNAISEIAKMSLRSVSLESPPAQSTSTSGLRKIPKQMKKYKKMVTITRTSQ